MLEFSRHAAFILILATLAGCASPRYQTTYRYQSPASAAGQRCVQGCEQALSRCQSACQADWQACAARVEPQVEARYVEALKNYELELNRYRHSLELYEWDLWQSWGYSHSGLWYSQPWSYHWPYHRPYLPYALPAQPSRERARAELLKSQCKDDCGCHVQYDACYLNCGGGKIPEQQCVANCPPPEPLPAR